MKVPVSLIPENLSPPQPASISRAGSQLSLEQTYDVIRRDRTGFIGSTMAALAASLSAITCVSSNAALKRQQRDQPRGECSIPLRHPPDYPIISDLVLTCPILSCRSSRPSLPRRIRVRRWSHRHRGCHHTHWKARRRPRSQGVRRLKRHARRQSGCPGWLLAGGHARRRRGEANVRPRARAGEGQARGPEERG